MLQIITTPLILLVSTVIPLLVTVESLHSRPTVNGRSLTRQLLKFWCLHALTRSIPNPVMYLFRALPLTNFLELSVWSLLTRELLGQFYVCNVPVGGSVVSDSSRNAGSWFGFFRYDVQQTTSRYVFGYFSVWLLQIVEKWPLDVKLLDSFFQAFLSFVVRIMNRNSSVAMKADPKSWSWTSEWFRQVPLTDNLGEDYDMLEDVMEDVRNM